MDAEAKRRAACCELVFDVARRAGEVRLKVTGGSMLPAMWPGDVVTVRRCNAAELQLGQIILFCRDGKFTTHRIARFAGDHLITRGDTLRPYDPPVRSSEVVGQVVSILRDGRSIRPEDSIRHRVVSSILRRSNLCKRITLRVSRHLRGPRSLQASWANSSSSRAGK